MQPRIVIVSGGSVGEWVLKHINKEDFLLCVDRGALFLLKNGLRPHYVIGDFDSVTNEEFLTIKESCPQLSACDPVDKDLTDTEMAFRWALAKVPASILLLGVTGSRLDHTLANIHLLRHGMKQGVYCTIIDENNEIMITDSHLQLERSAYQYVSLLPLTSQVIGVTLEGFKYPLTGARLEIGNSLSISNQQIADTARISIEQGELLVIRSRD